MSKTDVLHARIDSELKENVENIFAQLGLTSTDAIKLFYKQVELNGGLPFEIKIPMQTLAENKLLEELKKGAESAEKYGWMSLEESKRKFGIWYEFNN